MKIASLTCLLCILLATPVLAEPLVITLEPPAEGYSEKKPDYLHFKEITVTRTGRKEMNFDITLQGNLPETLPGKTGIRYKLYIDLSDFVTDTAEKKKGDFAEDIQVAIYINPGMTEFDTWTHTLKYKGKTWRIDITHLSIGDDTISFSATANLFAERNIGMRFLFSSGLLQGTGRSRKDRTVQDTAVYDLPAASGTGAF